VRAHREYIGIDINMEKSMAQYSVTTLCRWRLCFRSGV